MHLDCPAVAGARSPLTTGPVGDQRCAARGALSASDPAVGAHRPRPGLIMAFVPIGLTPSGPLGGLGCTARPPCLRPVVCFGVNPIVRRDVTHGSGPRWPSGSGRGAKGRPERAGRARRRGQRGGRSRGGREDDEGDNDSSHPHRAGDLELGYSALSSFSERSMEGEKTKGENPVGALYRSRYTTSGCLTLAGLAMRLSSGWPRGKGILSLSSRSTQRHWT